jgi:Arc/MetJ-type ribon-helix-helix transcriptional regulator
MASGDLAMLDSYPPDLQEFVQQKIASGVFRSADEFAMEAAALYRDMDRRREELKAKIARATEELERGEGIVHEDEQQLRAFFEGIKAEGRRRLATQSAASGEPSSRRRRATTC